MQPWRNKECVRFVLVLDLSKRSMPRLSPTMPSSVSSVVAKHAPAEAGGTDQQQPVAAHWLADACGGQAHAKLQILGVAELRLDGPALGIVVDQRCCCRIPQAGGQAPWFLHTLGMHTNDRADKLALRGDTGVAQFSGAPALTHPLGRRPDQPVSVGYLDIATEANDIIEPEFAQESE